MTEIRDGEGADDFMGEKSSSLVEKSYLMKALIAISMGKLLERVLSIASKDPPKVSSPENGCDPKIHLMERARRGAPLKVAFAGGNVGIHFVGN